MQNPLAYTHQGQRPYQEDNFFIGETFAIVCDGVGGRAKGDIASGISVEVVSERLQTLTTAPEVDIESYMVDTIMMCSNHLEAISDHDPDSKGLATTLVCVFGYQGEMYVTHIGDSRLYHFGSDGNIKWKTTDHSMVQELINAGIISEEEAENHPRKNIITRCIGDVYNQQQNPHTHHLQDFQKGDTILLCSDGVLEAWTDTGLEALIATTHDNAQRIGQIQERASAIARDNNTAIIFTIDESSTHTSVIQEKESDINLDDLHEHKREENPTSLQPELYSLNSKKFDFKSGLKYLVPVLIISVVIYSYTTYFQKTKEELEIPKNSHLQSSPAKSMNILKTDNKIQSKNLNQEAISKEDEIEKIIVSEDSTLIENLRWETLKNNPSQEDLSQFITDFPNSKFLPKVKSALVKLQRRDSLESKK